MSNAVAQNMNRSAPFTNNYIPASGFNLAGIHIGFFSVSITEGDNQIAYMS